jgi:hypothetical protein
MSETIQSYRKGKKVEQQERMTKPATREESRNCLLKEV